MYFCHEMCSPSLTNAHGTVSMSCTMQISSTIIHVKITKVPTFLCDTNGRAGPTGGLGLPGAVVLNRQLGARCEYWKLNPCHPQEEYVLLTAKTKFSRPRSRYFSVSIWEMIVALL